MRGVWAWMGRRHRTRRKGMRLKVNCAYTPSHRHTCAHSCGVKTIGAVLHSSTREHAHGISILNTHSVSAYHGAGRRNCSISLAWHVSVPRQLARVQQLERNTFAVQQKLHQASEAHLVFAVAAGPARVGADAESPKLETQSAMAHGAAQVTWRSHLVLVVDEGAEVAVQLEKAHALRS